MPDSSGPPGRPPRKTHTESYELGIADTGPISAAAIQGDVPTAAVSALEATQNHRAMRAQRATEPQPTGRRGRRAAGTNYLPAVDARAARHDTVEDSVLMDKVEEA